MGPSRRQEVGNRRKVMAAQVDK